MDRKVSFWPGQNEDQHIPDGSNGSNGRPNGNIPEILVSASNTSRSQTPDVLPTVASLHLNTPTPLSSPAATPAGTPAPSMRETRGSMSSASRPERPQTKRSTSRVPMFRLNSSSRVPRHGRSKSVPDLEAPGDHASSHAPSSSHGRSSMWARVGQRVQHNLRAWYVRDRWKRASEIDHFREVQKSNLLFAELFTVTPTVMLLAGNFQADEKGEKRVPVLVHQLNLKVTRASGNYRHMVRIHLEYGNGPAVIRWSLVRGYRDFLWLKTRLGSDKVGSAAVKQLKHPKLPKPRKFPKEHSAESESSGSDSEPESDEELVDDSQSFEEAIEDYLKKLIRIYQFRPDSNRIMAFLELSHMSIKLAPEYGYHGKEGTLIMRSRASEMGWHMSHLHPKDIGKMITRHTPKWVLVRESYVVIVDNIYSTKVREVFLVDSHFDIKHIDDSIEDNELAEKQLQQSSDPASASLPGPSEAAFGPVDIPEAPDALARPPVLEQHKPHTKSVFLHLRNNERNMKLAAYSDRELRRWQASIVQMKQQTPWSRRNRFDSFAPVRKNVFGQWFVDGRDYMWVLSEALENARDTIYILDWWLSPELYLRRPPEGNQQWRLDRVLKRKAEQGVKIFVVVYRNVGAAIPIDSLWTKYSLLDLHPNIHVIRSPHQLNQRHALFWAHHEKVCVVDATVAFNGGIDLCYGRWDTWEHNLTDDAPNAFSADPSEKTQMWPGKDYTNERAKDYFGLDHPYDEQLDRDNQPRMPWHDVHQMVVGQPARDLARHFVQRWNYVLRQKLPSRKTPLLLPPPDFTQTELERLGLTGTCEYQVLRSSGDWSLGLRHHEQSIQNAYLKLIQESEHFVYIENQFFITSTEVDGILIENQIGNALVQRIIRAHASGEKWRAFILLPLLPGFEAEVDTNEAASVRVICQCQFNSISRGPHSLFYRLESLGIRPDQYIHFFSLRQWGKFSEPNQSRLITEILYIHGKTMIVDDRVALIGSANINERSMRGLRDSEVAVVVRDTKVVESRMAGKPWKAAKFAHSLRVRLMREHLGVDIDKLDVVHRMTDQLGAAALNYETGAPGSVPGSGPASVYSGNGGRPSSASDTPSKQRGGAFDGFDTDEFPEWLYPELHSFNWYAGTEVNRGVREHKKVSTDSRIQGNAEHKADVDGDGYDQMNERIRSGRIKPLPHGAPAPGNPEEDKRARVIMAELMKDRTITSQLEFLRKFYARLASQDILRPVQPASQLKLPHVSDDGKRALDAEPLPIDPWGFNDPLDDEFLYDKWFAAAERNTFIFRQVFRCQPDDEVETWKDYKKFQGHMERFYAKQREDGGPDALRAAGHHSPERVDLHVLNGTIKSTNPEGLKSPLGTPGGSPPGTPAPSRPTSYGPSRLASRAPSLNDVEEEDGGGYFAIPRTNNHKISEPASPMHKEPESVEGNGTETVLPPPPPPMLARRWGHFEHVLDAQVAEDMLRGVTGHLVVFPTEWLNRELDSGNWNFQKDRMAPLEIFD